MLLLAPNRNPTDCFQFINSFKNKFLKNLRNRAQVCHRPVIFNTLFVTLFVNIESSFVTSTKMDQNMFLFSQHILLFCSPMECWPLSGTFSGTKMM